MKKYYKEIIYDQYFSLCIVPAYSIFQYLVYIANRKKFEKKIIYPKKLEIIKFEEKKKNYIAH